MEEKMDQEFMFFYLEKFREVLKSYAFDDDANGHQEQKTVRQHGAQVESIGSGIQKLKIRAPSLENMDDEITSFDPETLSNALKSLAITFEHDANGHQERETAKQHGAQVEGIGSDIQKQIDLKAVLLNVRSLKNEAKNEANKADNCVFFKNVKLHVFLLTETWLTKETADEELKKVFPSNYKFYHESEEAQKKKGVAIIVSEDLESESVKCLPTTKTFQYVAIELKRKEWAKHILIINLYRRPIPFTQFLEEFETFLEKAVKCNKEVILTGDFNLPNSKKFKHLLKEKCLEPHVKGKTHYKGNTLDLVISQLKEFHICNTTVDQRDGRLKTDHYPVYFSTKENEAK